MKAAILTCNTGEGHNAAAKAICEELERRNIDCEVVDTLSLAGKYTSDIVSGLFSKMVTTIPLAFDLMYRTSDLVSGIVPKSPMYYANFLYAKKLLNFLIEGGFDTAICSHLFPAEALTYLRHSSNFSVDCYMVVTDYTCVPFVDETDMDAYFIPHSHITPAFMTYWAKLKTR